MENKMANLEINGHTAAPDSLGHGMLKHFSFDKDWCNLNHGSFGTHPKVVRDVQRSHQDAAEARPDAYMRYYQVIALNEARKSLADLVNAPLNTIVMVPNVTTAINTVLRNIHYEPGDMIIYFSTTYGACQNIVLATMEFTPVKAHRIELVYPLSDGALLSKLETAVDELRAKGLNPRLCLFDTIPSMPGVRMPFEKLTALCKRLGIFSVIDGAHAIGHLPLDLSQLDPDFFVSNCHKWLYTPRGCAIMYVPERNQGILRTSFPTSHYYTPLPTGEDGGGHFNPLPPPSGDDTPYTKLFEFVGTIDSSPYFCVPAALKFRREVCGGEEMIYKYSTEVVHKGAAHVAKVLGTETMENAEGTLQKDCALVQVRLPLSATSTGEDKVDLADKPPASIIDWVQRKMISDHKTLIPLLWHADKWWARFSGQIYLEAGDFEFGAKVLKDLCDRVKAGEHLKK